MKRVMEENERMKWKYGFHLEEADLLDTKSNNCKAV